jgi:predicted nucleotidyltransferase component of viral defense system
MSIYQRLLNKARETGRPFNEMFQYFAMERFLYRLSQSPHAEKFILKGALMLIVWKTPISRPTMDIDLLGKTDNNMDALSSLVKDVCLQEVEPDGIVFDPESIVCARIVEDAEYEGVRVRFCGNLGNARINMQLDIGFGDEVYPSPEVVVYPTILDLPAPLIRGYSRESIVAEKFEAMVKFGELNSRMKDFYDLWLISQQYEFNGEDLSTAISITFARRGTTIEANPIALMSSFSNEPEKSTQWKAFRKKSHLVNAPEDFGQVLTAIAGFLKPLAEALAKEDAFKGTWKAPGPWLM